MNQPDQPTSTSAAAGTDELVAAPTVAPVAAAVRLSDLPVQQRDAMIAEVLTFLLERGYTITAPGSTAAVPATGHFGFASRTQ